MQKNYIILAHKNPHQIKHLVEKLNDGSSCFYIHIDINTDSVPFQNALSDNSNVNFIKKRETGTWGDLGIVKATINAMREIIASQNSGYCILLSGQDYPIKSSQEINAYLSKENGTDFIEISPIKEVFPVEWNIRLNYYKYNLSEERGKYVLFPSKINKSFFSVRLLKNIAKIIVHKKGMHFIKEIVSNFNKERKIPQDIIPFAGGQWWALTTETVSKIMTFIDNNPGFVNYHKYSLLPDEVFFQTIIKYLSSNDSQIQFKDSVTYINWSRKNCSLPVTFNDADLNELTTQPEHNLFARKFDFDYNIEIINQLDRLN